MYYQQTPLYSRAIIMQLMTYHAISDGEAVCRVPRCAWEGVMRLVIRRDSFFELNNLQAKLLS